MKNNHHGIERNFSKNVVIRIFQFSCVLVSVTVLHYGNWLQLLSGSVQEYLISDFKMSRLQDFSVSGFQDSEISVFARIQELKFYEN